MNRIQRHLISIGLVVVLALFGTYGVSAAAATGSTGAHSVTSSVPRPMPDPHP
jgi:hypothetical protein